MAFLLTIFPFFPFDLFLSGYATVFVASIPIHVITIETVFQSQLQAVKRE